MIVVPSFNLTFDFKFPSWGEKAEIPPKCDLESHIALAALLFVSAIIIYVLLKYFLQKEQLPPSPAPQVGGRRGRKPKGRKSNTQLKSEAGTSGAKQKSAGATTSDAVSDAASDDVSDAVSDAAADSGETMTKKRRRRRRKRY